MNFGLFSADRAKEISEYVSRDDNRPGYTQDDPPKDSIIKYVKLIEDLPPATEELTGYSQASAVGVPLTDTDDLDRAPVPSVTATNYLITNRSTSFEVDYTSTPYLWIVRDGPEWVPLNAGNALGFAMIIGTASNVSCPYASMDITPTYTSAGCSVTPGLSYGIASAVDLLGIMTPYKLPQLTGATVLAAYMFPVDYCSVGQWIILAIVATSGCS